MIYYVVGEDAPILAPLIYGKGEQVNPTPVQKRAMEAVVNGFRTTIGRRRKT